MRATTRGSPRGPRPALHRHRGGRRPRRPQGRWLPRGTVRPVVWVLDDSVCMCMGKIKRSGSTTRKRAQVVVVVRRTRDITPTSCPPPPGGIQPMAPADEPRLIPPDCCRRSPPMPKPPLPCGANGASTHGAGRRCGAHDDEDDDGARLPPLLLLGGRRNAVAPGSDGAAGAPIRSSERDTNRASALLPRARCGGGGLLLLLPLHSAGAARLQLPPAASSGPPLADGGDGGGSLLKGPGSSIAAATCGRNAPSRCRTRSRMPAACRLAGLGAEGADGTMTMRSKKQQAAASFPKLFGRAASNQAGLLD